MIDKTTDVNNPINHPVHYNRHPSGIECIAVCRLMTFAMGNAVKYIWRANLKNGIEDYKKARRYLNDHLTNGFASFPGHKAKDLLLNVIAAEPRANVDRRMLLQLIARGQLELAIGYINHLVGPE